MRDTRLMLVELSGCLRVSTIPRIVLAVCSEILTDSRGCPVTITSVAPPAFDVDELRNSLVITVDLTADVESAWSLWSDPRVLEKWWGPPDYPCVISRFELQPGGHVRYVMTGPDGTEYLGWWQVLDVEAPNNLRIRDGFGESPEHASSAMPIATSSISFTPIDDTVRMQIDSRYDSAEELQRALDLHMEEGFLSALSQIEFMQRD
jgi:uncharacterized protein YndB with AHSA1/START domain